MFYFTMQNWISSQNCASDERSMCDIHSKRAGRTWVWLNNVRIFFLGWIIPLTFTGLHWITHKNASFNDEYWLGQCWKHFQLQNEQRSREKQELRTLKPTSVLNNNTIHLAQNKAQSHREWDKHPQINRLQNTDIPSWSGEPLWMQVSA